MKYKVKNIVGSISIVESGNNYYQIYDPTGVVIRHWPEGYYLDPQPGWQADFAEDKLDLLEEYIQNKEEYQLEVRNLLVKEML